MRRHDALTALLAHEAVRALPRTNAVPANAGAAELASKGPEIVWHGSDPSCPGLAKHYRRLAETTDLDTLEALLRPQYALKSLILLPPTIDAPLLDLPGTAWRGEWRKALLSCALSEPESDRMALFLLQPPGETESNRLSFWQRVGRRPGTRS